jgi:hypothetical protein
MNSKYFYEDYDLSRIIFRPLAFGLFVNVILPVGLLAICYYINNNYFMLNRLGDSANPVFFVFAVLAAADAALAFWLRSRLLAKPMIRSESTFQQDLSDGLLKASRLISLLLASISIWGYLYFFLTGRFTAATAFVLFSFVSFQVVRPRFGAVRKLIDRQKAFVRIGRLLTD